MRVFFLPASDQGMQDRVLKAPDPYKGGMWNLPFLDGLADALKAMGHEVHTTDWWTRETSRPDDVLLVQNHPGETFWWRMFYRIKNWKTGGGFIIARKKFLEENYRFFARRVLLHAESPMVTLSVYAQLPEIAKSGLYHKIMIMGRGWGEEYEYFNLYYYRDQDIMSPLFSDPKRKFLVLINANMRPHALGNEFYGERLKAIKYFSNVSGFDVYGYWWDKLPRHPFYMHYKKYVDRVWRGVAKNKIEIMSQYQFALVYENAAYEGYVSEKIFDCLASGSIPIYLGAPDINTIVPPDCFIDLRKFKNYKELHSYLSQMTEEEKQKYRENIMRFLRDRSTMRGMRSLAEKVIGQ